MKKCLNLSLLLFAMIVSSHNWAQSNYLKMLDSINIEYTNRPFIGTFVITKKEDTILVAQYDKEGNIRTQKVIAQGTLNTLQETFYNATSRQYKTRTYIPANTSCSEWIEDTGDTTFNWVTPTTWHKINQMVKQSRASNCGQYLEKKDLITAFDFYIPNAQWLALLHMPDKMDFWEAKALYKPKYTFYGLNAFTYKRDEEQAIHAIQFDMTWQYDTKISVSWSKIDTPFSAAFKIPKSSFHNRLKNGYIRFKN
jgi:hypothetical protein